MRKNLSCLVLAVIAIFLFTVKSNGQDIPKELYSAAGIPDSLKEDANSVVRYSNDEVIIEGPGKAVVKHHLIVTILNEKADKQAIVVLPYNKKFFTVSDISIHVYDAAGALIKKYHKGDMEDVAALNDEILISDDRLLGVRHVVSAYPTTIEVEYEEDQTSFIQFQWDIQGEDQSIQSAKYSITINPEIGLRYQARNISLTSNKISANGKDTYTWNIANKKAIKVEDGAMPWRVLPELKIGVNKFEYYGFNGDFSTWQNFGKWQQVLNADVCDLSPQRVAEIQKMTDTIKTDKAKAKFLYEYMQKNMRYVAVALGIGGLKPFAATFVDQKKYGDCKAFSNYMCALLKAVNIPAYYSIVHAEPNEEPLDPSFPFDITNHIIVCVPFKNDTTWLECTSSTKPFGKLGSFTENRNALLITPEGGKLVNTPKSIADDNVFTSEVHLAIDSDGSAKAQVKILGTGVYRDDYIGLSYAKTDDQKEFLMHVLNIKQASVFDFTQGKDENGVKEVNLNLEYDKFCDIMAGTKQFYRPRVFDLCAFTVPVLEKRNSDYYYESPMKKTCVTTIDLPANYEIEALPANQSLKFTYGNYEISYVYNVAKNQVISTAKFIITNQVIPAAKYNEMQQYLDAVAKAQNKKLVIRHKA
jgi:hypothetical protein